MIAIFILFFDVAIQCINTVCQQVPALPVKMMITAGTLELIFELGVVSIYAHKRRK
jgi:uncharacterized protein YqgC (DUF456 family)